MPRTLLLTQWPPDAKYKILRRYADMFPDDSLIWASLQPCSGNSDLKFSHRAVIPRQLHWRLKRFSLGWWYLHQWQARQMAQAIAVWARPFKPDVLWVLPELGAAHVAPHLAQMLGIPIHATSHDAHETAKEIVPPLYYPLYARAVSRVFRMAKSVDAISEGLLEHLREDFPALRSESNIVFHPSIAPTLISRPVSVRDSAWEKQPRRVIGLCGSMRISEAQWISFLETLSRLPYTIEIVSLAYKDRFFETGLPGNVRIIALPFAETEADVIRVFHEQKVDALFLGLWRDPSQLLFGKTSLSAKLVTYAASSLPIIVDADQESMAWRLVSRHGAGILLSGAPGDSTSLLELFRNAATWNKAAEGAGQLCAREFNLDDNFSRFSRCLELTAGQG